MLSFVPLHLFALERCPGLRSKLMKIITPGYNEDEVEILEYEGWFERGHNILGGEKNEDGIWIPKYKKGTFIWTPPPSGALIAVEQLRRARLKRESSTHVVVVPRLMSPEWKRQLFRVSDLFIELPFDELWKRDEQHEPLIFAVVFPFLNFRPWQLKKTGAFLGLVNVLRRMWQDDKISSWDLLWKLFCQTRELESL